MMAALPSEMLALVLHDFGDMRLASRPTPIPQPGEALVRTLATGICGSDLHGYTGHNGRRQPGQVMGHETVGEVVALGASADTGGSKSGLAVGDIVVLNPNLSCGECDRCREGNVHLCTSRRVIGVDPTISSAFAAYVAAPAGNLVRFHGRAIHGALVEPLAVGYHAAVRGGVEETSAVLVVGGGPIGQAVAIAARRLGASIIAVSEPNPARRALVASLGFDVIDPGHQDAAAAMAQLTPTGADVALDAVGSSATLATALAATRTGGRIVLVGMATPTVELPAYEISTQERDLIGAFCYTPTHFADTAAWVENNEDSVTGLISRVVEPEHAPAAFAALADGADQASKIIVQFATTD